MNRILLDFEKRVELGPTFAARLLGVSYSIYAQYRSDRRTLPRYHRNHLRALLLLSKTALAREIDEHVHGQSLNRHQP